MTRPDNLWTRKLAFPEPLVFSSPGAMAACMAGILLALRKIDVQVNCKATVAGSTFTNRRILSGPNSRSRHMADTRELLKRIAARPGLGGMLHMDQMD
jgi:hypothetical protein